MNQLRLRYARRLEMLKSRFKIAWCSAWIFLMPILIIACGGSLGKIQVENVNAVITKSENVVEQARVANAQALAPDVLHQAESALEKAKAAMKTKHGLEAIRLAYNALTQARLAEQQAMDKSQEIELTAMIQRKESEINGLQNQLQETQRTEEAQREQSLARIQELELNKSELQAKINQKTEEIKCDRQRILQDYRIVKTELKRLKSLLDTAKAQNAKAQNLQLQQKALEYEQQISLRQELALAQAKAEEARKEVEKARSNAKAQARGYTKQIEQLEIDMQDKDLEIKALESQAYIERRKKREPRRTGRSDLNEDEVAKAKAVITDWYLAWVTRNLNLHLTNYAQNVEIEQIIIHRGGEDRGYLSRRKMVDILDEMADDDWNKIHSQFEAEGESVIGTYRFSRLSQTRYGSPAALYDVWIREIWVGQIREQWKIFRETWEIYEDVPKYAAIFN